jgi:hypothetical protein
MVPIAEHAESFELRALDLDALPRVGIARFADADGVRAGIACLRISWET